MKNLQPLKKLLFPSFYNKDKSEVTAKVIGKGNYTGTNDKKVSTNMASLSDALVTVPKTRNYSAKAGDFMKASVNVKESSAKGASALKKGKDYDVEYFINDSKTKATGDEVTKPGDVITVKVSAKDGSYYKDEKRATFTIVQNLNKADLKLKKDNGNGDHKRTYLYGWQAEQYRA